MDFTIFKQNLRHLIESRGYTIKSFSEDIRIPAATISRYLSGSRIPDLAYVVKISKHFDVSVDWLLGINGEKFAVLPKDVQNVVHCYQLATIDDRRVVKAVLDKYNEESSLCRFRADVPDAL